MPAVTVVGAAAKSVVVKRLVRLVLAALPVVAAGGLAIGLIALLTFAGARSSDEGAVSALGTGCSTITQDSGMKVDDLTTEQIANAQTIVAVGRQLNVPAYGWVIAIATALQESTLVNLDHGDRDSVGLFQQRTGWGPLENRMNPIESATMFYSGGKNGQDGLLDIPFQTMTLTAAAQEVQHSAFPDAYSKWQTLATSIVGNPAVVSASCGFVDDGTAGARAVQAAMQMLGTPYSWGGGGISGPGRGFGRGANTIGFDCSSLVQYAWHQATGVTLPRVTNAQAAALPRVTDMADLRAGDLLFFGAPGQLTHVGIYDGHGGMIHAPRTGRTVEAIENVLEDAYWRDRLRLAVRVGEL